MISGAEPWPPPLLGCIGLQWFWRLLMDPAGKWRRYLVGNPLLILRLLKQRRGDFPRETAATEVHAEPRVRPSSGTGQSIPYPPSDSTGF